MPDPTPHRDTNPDHPPPRTDSTQPMQVGRFRIEGTLGSGGMGTVHEAWDPRLERALALKVLSAEQVRQPEARERLLREARAAASLNHPNIAIVYEVGSSQGIDWIAMERIHGKTLRDRIRRGDVTVTSTLEWGLQICDAIAEAHEHGIIHRDIKSVNVMVTARNQIKVLDFGLAIASGWTVPSTDETLGRLTQTGVVLGTVDYMAPEILRGEEASPRSDVFSLGALLYEMVTGRTPFAGRTPILVMNAILSDDPPKLSKGVRDLPKGLEDVIEKSLSKDPSARQGSARELHRALGAVFDAYRAPGPRTAQALSGVTGEVPNNLPASVTRFIGRDAELQELHQLLDTDRLVTITGPGGAGKTRLALELGRKALRDFPGGVYFIDFAPRTEAVQIAAGVAEVVDVREGPGRDLVEALVESLEDRKLLLLLDNCEHLVDATAELAARLLKECANLQILATSQERLDVPGEFVWAIPSLTLPPERASMETTLESSCVQLFVDRATSVKSSFVLTEQTAPTVAQICKRLDAIPLAIELAAARVRILTVEQILERLEDRFRLLTGGSRTVLPRQQTLHNTVAWSVDLLSEAERGVFERISVFAGGFSLDTVEEIAAGDGIEESEVLDLVSRLVDKSLLTAKTEGNVQRYDQLATLREYAAELLSCADNATAVHERHANHFLRLAESAAPELTGPDQSKWFTTLALESGNLTRAMRHFTKSERFKAVRMGAALWRFWLVRGELSAGRRRLAEALALSEIVDQDSGAARARALHGAGVLANDQGDYAAARASFETCLAIRRRLEDRSGVAQTLNSLGIAARDQGDYATARPLLEEGLAIHRDIGDAPGVAMSIHALGITAHCEDDFVMARRLFEEGLAIRRRAGDRRGIAALLAHLGSVAYDQCSYDEAERLLNDGLEMFRELENKRGILWSLMHLGGVSQRRGDLEKAQDQLHEALRLTHQLGDRHHMARSLEWIAGLAVAQGQPQRALRLLGAAMAVRDDIGSPRTPLERRAVGEDEQLARQKVGAAETERLIEEGRLLDTDDAVQEALR